MTAKLSKFFPNFCKIFLEQCFWTLDVEKFRTIMLNIAETHILLVEKEISGIVER